MMVLSLEKLVLKMCGIQVVKVMVTYASEDCQCVAPSPRVASRRPSSPRTLRLPTAPPDIINKCASLTTIKLGVLMVNRANKHITNNKCTGFCL